MPGEQEFDAIVVGSGLAGGWAAKELTERGCATLLLEAGRALEPARDFPPESSAARSKLQIATRVRAVLGGQPIQARCMSYSAFTRHLFINDRENPYTTAPDTRFNWYRSRHLGGRSHLWGRNALRIGDEQLHAAQVDGFGATWPLAYADLAPWYARVEQGLGVHGSPAGLTSIPDGVYDQPLPLTDAERSVLDRLAQGWPDRAATTCRIICHDSNRVPLSIRAAAATGRLTIRTGAVVARIGLGAADRANGVHYVDCGTGQPLFARGRVIVLCASTIETLRIMLNSTSTEHPRGLGNSSGTLGRGITDHVMVFKAGPHPIEGVPRDDPYDFGAQSGIYVPSFRNREGRRDVDFLRGYSLLGSVGRIEPGWFFMAIGEMLSRPENMVTVDAGRRDAWGIPVARIRCRHSDNERAMVRDMNAALLDLARVCGLEVDALNRESLVNRLVYRFASRLVYTPEGALVPGSAIHEAGGAAMGTDAATSVLNRHNQCWDVPNVFVTDSASFASSPYQNPGLTIMALSARAGAFIADECAAARL
jgi:choline dehydrogenase-like flavoprotein